VQVEEGASGNSQFPVNA